MQASEIDRIARIANEEQPHIGAETEVIATNTDTLDVVHNVGENQTTEAVRQWLMQEIRALGIDPKFVTDFVTPDVPETTVEANPEPVRSPISSAASQRLMAIIVDMAMEQMSGGKLQGVNGASLRPTNTTTADASRNVPLWKQIYYAYQITTHGDKIAAAAGDHLNLSAPWGDQNPRELSRKMIEMTSRMRLIGGALSIALSAASPLHYYANGTQEEPTFGTALTPWESARLGHVWPGRTIMDIPGLYESPANFTREMTRFGNNGILKSGRDVWLPVRAQPGPSPKIESFEEACTNAGLNPYDPRAAELLTASFEYGPNNERNPFQKDADWKAVEAWRQKMLQGVINTPRNRVEVRTLETPPAFEGQTPYEYMKAVQNFLDLLFIYLSTNPEFAANLEYDALNLAAAKSNEEAVLKNGMDARVYWIPEMRQTTSREILGFLLEKIRDLAKGLGREEDLQIIQQIVEGGLKTPAQRIREEVGSWYGINIEHRDNARLLQDDTYPKAMLARTRDARDEEIVQITKDLDRMPLKDQPYIKQLLDVVAKLKKPELTA